MNPFFSRFTKDNVLVGAGYVLNFIKPLVLTPLILKTAPVEVFGAYVLLISVAGLIAGFAPAGVDFLCKRRLPSAETPERKRELFYPQLAFQGLVLLVCGIALILLDVPLRVLFFKGAPAFSMPLVVCYVFCYALYGQLADYFRYSGRMRVYMAASVAYPYISILMVIALRVFWDSFSVNNLLFAEIAALAVIVVWLSARIINEIGLSFPSFSAGEIKESVRLGFPLLMVSVNEFFLFGGVRYIIAAFLGVGSVAAFTAATQLGNLALFLPRALGVALPPLLCQAEDSGHKREFNTMMKYALKSYLLVSIPFAVLTLLLGRELLELFSNGEVARQAWILVPLVAFANVLYGISLILSRIFVVESKTTVLFKASVIACVMSFAVNILSVWLTRSVWPSGAAIFASYAIMLAVIMRDNARCCTALAEIRVKSIFGVSVCAVLGSYLMALLIFPAAMPGRVLWTSLLAVALYLTLVLATDVITAGEINFAKTIFKPRSDQRSASQS